MGKTFRDWDIEQLMMFPPSVEDFVPQGHVAHFVRSTVSEALDLSAIVDCYNEERGYPPYHPVMMTALLLYAYCQGIYPSSRLLKNPFGVLRQAQDERRRLEIPKKSPCMLSLSKHSALFSA